MIIGLSLKDKIFIIYIVSILKLIIIIAYFSKKTRIIFLNLKKVFISTRYSNFIDIFLSNFIVELLEYININNYFTKFVNNKNLFYNLIYSLKLIELKTLET